MSPELFLAKDAADGENVFKEWLKFEMAIPFTFVMLPI